MARPETAESVATPGPPRDGIAGGLPAVRVLVGNGDAIQALARRIDPEWQNPFTGRTPEETASWLASAEVLHWALLAGSVAPIAAALWYGHYVLGFVCVAATILFNLAPNLVMRDTRQRLLRISRRIPAAGTGSDRAGSGGDAAALVAEVPSTVGPTGAPGS